MILIASCLMIASSMFAIAVIAAKNIDFIAKQSKNAKKIVQLVICASTIVGIVSAMAGIIFYCNGNAFIT